MMCCSYDYNKAQEYRDRSGLQALALVTNGTGVKSARAEKSSGLSHVKAIAKHVKTGLFA